MTLKACDTTQLLAMDAEAQKRGFSRQVDMDLLNIDPAGQHLICPWPVFISGAFVRCKVYLKIIGANTPVESTMDVTDSWLASLPSASLALQRQVIKEKRASVGPSLDKILRKTS